MCDLKKLREAMDYAEGEMKACIEELIRVENMFPDPAPEPFKQLKERLSNVQEAWRVARDWADNELRRLSDS
ncbi:MAG: hypothetical protein A3G18_08945 [Rhodospirillales bacterium RIFCSPLOWO2_12_FULL_58_28]|nr:MAG: hypothetical protein A3H92_01540 [Rhodospirillales bacterium RIFCSPLOWO2_02_FULL_58_16]OHC78431.1 MAG: hypothetical protein A3G18_08945 [Rhodospirillales bacterium RIFCSPLOWO2_12_FULL_58_28]